MLMMLKLVNPQNFQVSGGKCKEAATFTAAALLREIQTRKKFHFHFLERNTEKAIYIFSDLLYAIDLF